MHDVQKICKKNCSPKNENWLNIFTLPQAIQEFISYSNWKRFGEIKYYITSSPIDPLADTSITIIHTTPANYHLVKPKAACL